MLVCLPEKYSGRPSTSYQSTPTTAIQLLQIRGLAPSSLAFYVMIFPRARLLRSWHYILAIPKWTRIGSDGVSDVWRSIACVIHCVIMHIFAHHWQACFPRRGYCASDGVTLIKLLKNMLCHTALKFSRQVSRSLLVAVYINHQPRDSVT